MTETGRNFSSESKPRKQAHYFDENLKPEGALAYTSRPHPDRWNNLDCLAGSYSLAFLSMVASFS